MEERDKDDIQTGVLDVPPPSRAQRIEAMGGDAPLPESYIVPAFRHWFDADFKRVPGRIFTAADGRRFGHNQGGIDACVGHGGGLVKTDHEGTPMSSRDAWNVAKRIDASQGYALASYGATMWAGIEALDEGLATEATVPSEPNGRTREEYLDMDAYLTPAVKDEREAHKGKGTPFYCGRDSRRRMLYSTGHAMMTSLAWWSGDNDCGGLLGSPEGKDVGGHCIDYVGWIGGVDVYANSFGNAWGYDGLLYAPLSVAGRFGNYYGHVDASDPLPLLLARYDGKDLRRVGTPELWRCELGIMRKYPDELTWWSFGKLFGYDTFDITPADFDAIPKGEPMNINDAPAKTRELVRQVLGLKGKV